jgi:hypothetical protein
MDRGDIMDKCPEEFEGELKEFIDEIESRVNDAESELIAIKAVDDLHRVEDCRSILALLSLDLY